MAQNILTPEEKKYLGKIARYLSSLGMRFGEINFEMGLVAAAKGGHIDIVDYMVALGANNFNQALLGGSIGGSIIIARKMIEFGARHQITSISILRIWRFTLFAIRAELPGRGRPRKNLRNLKNTKKNLSKGPLFNLGSFVVS